MGYEPITLPLRHLAVDVVVLRLLIMFVQTAIRALSSIEALWSLILSADAVRTHRQTDEVTLQKKEN
jgi:hypothetical protein